MTGTNNSVMVEVLRGGSVESAHRGALAVLDADGTVLLAWGDIERPIFPRSAVKVLQALPLVASGAADALGLNDEELALACASHNGEARHAATAAAMLAKAGVDADALECGAHWPYLDSAGRELAVAGAQPSALHNNCSGKHAGFVCLGHALGAGLDLRRFVSGYVQPGHPVMAAVTDALARSTGVDLSTAPRGTDGCSIPTFAVPLRALALAFARVGTGQGMGRDDALAALRLRRAVAAAPFMVAGSGRFDTRVMERLGERVFCKVGAEGVYCAALPERGLGLALKIDDGNNARAAEVVMAAALEHLLVLDLADAGFIGALAEPVQRNWNGIEVGGLRPSTALRDALARAA